MPTKYAIPTAFLLKSVVDLTDAEIESIATAVFNYRRVHGRTPAERSAHARKAVAARIARQTPERRREIGRRAALARWKNRPETPEVAVP